MGSVSLTSDLLLFVIVYLVLCAKRPRRYVDRLLHAALRAGHRRGALVFCAGAM